MILGTININKYWGSGDFETQKRIQELVFPDGLLLDVKKRTYLTRKVNSIFALTLDLSGSLEGEKKNGNRDFLLPSLEVASAITLSNQLERDLIAVANLAMYLKRIKNLDNKL
ncbi:MAG: hypothetical protein V4549_18900 [Bacteroidota bacterium]